jgi:ubiquinone/menaquinone biosynthesis C-methylase UbiE
MNNCEKISKGYDEFHRQRKLKLEEELKEPWNQMIISHLNIQEVDGLFILDCACGKGPLLKYFSEYTKSKPIGVDISNFALEKAKKYSQVVRASIYSLPFKDNSFDIVISAETIEHLESPEKGIEELCRVCKNFLFLTFPNYFNFRGIYLLYRKYIKKKPLGSEQPIERRLIFPQIILWLKKRGFKIKKIDGRRVLEIFLPKHEPFNISFFEKSILRRLLAPFALHLFIKAQKKPSKA